MSEPVAEVCATGNGGPWPRMIMRHGEIWQVAITKYSIRTLIISAGGARTWRAAQLTSRPQIHELLPFSIYRVPSQEASENF